MKTAKLLKILPILGLFMIITYIPLISVLFNGGLDSPAWSSPVLMVKTDPELASKIFSILYLALVLVLIPSLMLFFIY